MSELEIGTEAEDDSWVFDSLVNFLHGTVWKLPVFSFIEEKSVVFDPDSYNNMSPEKEEEYRKIHDEYKALVDYMLASFMEDLEVSPEQVEEACRSRETTSGLQPDSHVTKTALEQLWAAEDFTSFRRLMTRKNIDLQLQSLELLVSKYGVLSPSLRNSDQERGDDEDGDEDFLQVVIRYTDAENFGKPDSADRNPAAHNLHTIVSTRNRTQTQTHRAPRPDGAKPPTQLQYPLVPAPPPSAEPKSQLLKQEQAMKSDHGKMAGPTTTAGLPSGQALVEAIIETSGHDDSTDVEEAVEHEKLIRAAITSTAPEEFKMLESVRRALQDSTEQEHEQEPKSTAQIGNSLGFAVRRAGEASASPEDIQRRRDYMRAQRDKLVALKREERQKQVDREDAETKNVVGSGGSRPKSAKVAAQMALSSTPKTVVNERSLAARRALAERLKHELLRE